MRYFLFGIMVMAAGILTLEAKPSKFKYRIPCSGMMIIFEAICGIETRGRTQEVSTGNGVFDNGKLTECDFSDTICSVGLVESLCAESCEDKFRISRDGKKLIVDDGCKGVFTVGVCKAW